MLGAVDGLGLLDGLVGLGEDELNVAGVRHVGVDLRPGQWAVTGVSKLNHLRDREHGMCGGAAWGPG